MTLFVAISSRQLIIRQRHTSKGLFINDIPAIQNSISVAFNCSFQIHTPNVSIIPLKSQHSLQLKNTKIHIFISSKVQIHYKSITKNTILSQRKYKKGPFHLYYLQTLQTYILELNSFFSTSSFFAFQSRTAITPH